MNAYTATLPELDLVFRALTSEWREATRFSSAPSAAAGHPSYWAIVDLGPSVVPLILASLKESPGPWFAALRELTGVDPVPPIDRGHPEASAGHWLAWGHANGLV